MMKIVAFMLMMMACVQAHALTKSQFVGDWRCTTDFRANDGSVEKSVTYDTMNADGSMSQLWEVVSYEKTKKLIGVEHFTIKNRWHVRGDRLYISDFEIVDYVIYDDKKIPYDEEMTDYFKESWAEMYAEPYDSQVKFLNKDHFIFPEESANSSTECVRFTKQG